MKKLIFTLALNLVSILSFAGNSNPTYEHTYFTKNIEVDNAPLHEVESISNTDYWVTIYKFIQDAQKTSADKMVIKYDGKWKYVIPSPEALIQLDIIISHLTSGSSVNDGSFQSGMKKALYIVKKDKLVVTVR